MFCQKCGNEIQDGALFCNQCGTKVEVPEEPKAVFCGKCGNQLTADEKFCGKCGTPVGEAEQPKAEEKPAEVTAQAQDQKPQASGAAAYLATPMRNVAAFVLGIIAASFGTFGGLCMTMCADLLEFAGGGSTAFFCVFCASVAGLIGAIFCMTKARIGSILLAACTTLMGGYTMVCYADYVGVDAFTWISLILFTIATLIAALNSFIPKKK